MNKPEACCDNLIQTTAEALHEDVIALMLVAVQKDNLGLSVNLALKQSVHPFKETVGGISSGCTGSIPGVGLISLMQKP